MLIERFCCFKLETGGLIIGWMGIVSSVLKLLADLTGILETEELTDQLPDNIDEIDPNIKREIDFIKVLQIFATLLTLVHLAIAVLLIRGIQIVR